MMACLNTVDTALCWSLLRKGSRVFALLGKATPTGLAPFRRADLGRSWAVTAEHGSLRLERLVGDEELTGGQLVLPTPFSNEYGITGVAETPELVRSVYGLLPSEMEQLVTVLRRGSFPVLGFSRTDLKCGISSSIIPGYWPHVVISNMSLCGNVVSPEVFVRILVSSVPNGQLAVRFPSLQPVLKQMVKLILAHRRGIAYNRELLTLAPTNELVTK